MKSEATGNGEDAANYCMRLEPHPDRIPARTWAALRAVNGATDPFTDPRFHAALIDSRSVGGRSGWLPAFAVLERGTEIVGIAPLYEKQHSYGEYVFDWAWADAYRRHGLDYYPKGLVAIPFTPVPGARLLAIDEPSRRALAVGLIGCAREAGWSSMHVLFPPQADAAALHEAGYLERHGVQFHWTNPGYRDFNDYLAALTQPKRKKILAERRKVREAGIVVTAIEGPQIEAAHWQLFDQCYRMTYAQHGSTPYLTPAFFRQIGRTMPEHLLMCLARPADGGQAIAASLLFHDGQAIYGRHWGALEHVPCLHFEASYYTPIEWAIRRGIHRFEGGAQGEHKMARGFLPVQTCSAHWLAHPAFNDAVADFLARESGGIEAYLDELNERSPMRST